MRRQWDCASRAFGQLGSLGVLIAAAAMASTASGAGWLAPVSLDNEGRDASGVVSAAGPDRSVTLVWTRSLGGNSSGPAVVEAQRIAPDGTRGAIVPLAGTGENIVQPSLAVDASGVVTVAWSQRESGVGVVRWARLSATGALIGQSSVLSSGDCADAVAVVAVTGVGRGVIAWDCLAESPTRVRAAVMSPDGSVGAPIVLSDESVDAESPAVAVSPDGAASVLWREGAGWRPTTRTLDLESSAVGDPKELGEHPVAAPLAVARAADGSAVYAWQRDDGPPREVDVIAANPDGQFGSVSANIDPTFSSRPPRIAALPAGGALLVWQGSSGGDVIRLAHVDGGGQLGQVVSVGSGESPAISVGSLGSGMIARESGSGAARRIVATPVGSSGALGPDAVVSAVTSAGPSVSIAAGGESTVAWYGSATPRSIEYAHFDATPPALSPTIPANATAGTPVAFAAGATDRVDSQPITYLWQFGDGTTSTLADPTHTFTDPGVRTVRITATDAAGNSASTQRTLQVAPAPAGPVPDPGPTTPILGPPPPDTMAPVISALSLTPRRPLRGTPRQTTPRTRIQFRLSEPARVRIQVQKRAPGLRRGRACLAPTRTLRRTRARACVRFVNVGTIARPNATAGFNRVVITRLRVGRRTLTPGPHRIEVQATDAAGNRASPRTLAFTVRRAPAPQQRGR